MFEKKWVERPPQEQKVEISPETIDRLSEEENLLKKYKESELAKVFRMASIAAAAKTISPEVAKWLV